MSLVENTPEELLTTGTWSIDRAHSTVEFCVKCAMIQTNRHQLGNP